MRVKHTIFSTISSLSFHFTAKKSSLHQHHKPFLHLSLRTLAFMASESESISTVATTATDAAADPVVVDDDVKYGFNRAEMFKTNVNGTVDPPYDRHVFLCYKSHEVWPSRVEDSEDDPLPKLFAGALKARRSDIKVKTRLTVCEGHEDLGLSDGDVLIFPDMIKYRSLKETDVDGFIEDVVVSGKPWASGEQEVLAGSFVFVCAHNNRDRRCGVCGPPLIEKFKEEIEGKGLNNQVLVTACSHIGGHKYAGNLIIFSADSEGKIAGHWYGYVTPTDVPELLDQHIGKGVIIERIWRGQMGARIEDTEKAEDQKIPNGTTLNNNEVKPQELGSDERKENVVSCCQGTTGFQCCRDGSSAVKPEKKGPRTLFDWTGKWEQREVLTAVGVVGAVATVAVAYSFYRKSR